MSGLYTPATAGPWQYDDDNVSYDGAQVGPFFFDYPTYDGIGRDPSIPASSPIGHLVSGRNATLVRAS